MSRHAKVCKAFVSEKSFIETLVVVLDNTLRDLVFYVIGILINVSLHEGLRRNVAQEQTIPKLIDVLKDSNIEDLDLSKVAAKAIHNLTFET